MPDNFVQDPSNTQNYNRYSYVLNNPLMYTDPSGELSFKKIGRWIKKHVNLPNAIAAVAVIAGVAIIAAMVVSTLGVAGGFAILGGKLLGLGVVGLGFSSGAVGAALGAALIGAAIYTIKRNEGDSHEDAQQINDLITGYLPALVTGGLNGLKPKNDNLLSNNERKRGRNKNPIQPTINDTISPAKDQKLYRQLGGGNTLVEISAIEGIAFTYLLDCVSDGTCEDPKIWDFNNDGKLQKNEADAHWMRGSGRDIYVDNSKIDWKGLKIPKGLPKDEDFGLNTTTAFLNLPYETAATYGGTSFKFLGENLVSVMNQAYHYEYRSNNSLENIARNIMTFIGKPAEIKWLDIKGTDYDIIYNNPIFKVK